jgi:trans-aconitate 2-methyltransferase
MERPSDQDLDPGAFEGFRGLRLRPVLDLMAQISALPQGDIIDLGCGSGVAGPPLRQRFGSRPLVGVDASRSMVSVARKSGVYDRVEQADVAQWQPDTPCALIFSNALLHWLPDHQALIPHLVEGLAPSGTLAFQVPDQQEAPSHSLLGEIAQTLSARHGDHGLHNVLGLAAYHRMLAPLGAVSLWQTDFLQILPAAAHGHPVRLFTQSTAMRPYLAALPQPLHKAFVDGYDKALEAAYPTEPDGTVLYPFRRLFVVFTKGN